MGPFLLRATLTGFAMWIVTHFVHGLSFVGGKSPLERIGIIFVVVFKIFHLRPARRILLLEAEAAASEPVARASAPAFATHA